MSNILKAFNEHLLEFVDDIISIFPEKKSLRVTKTSLIAWKKINPKSLIKIWKEQLTDVYKSEILENNFDFFIKKNYEADISGAEYAKSILKAIDNLRRPISNMGDKNKEKSMKYVKNLTKLSEIYFSS